MIPSQIWYLSNSNNNGCISSNKNWQLLQLHTNIPRQLHINSRYPRQLVSIMVSRINKCLRCMEGCLFPLKEYLLQTKRLKILRRYNNNNRLWTCSLWCNKWWLKILLLMVKLTLNRWQCFNKCSQWSLWCKIWWQISNNPRLLHKFKSKKHQRKFLTLKTICFLIFSKQLQALVHHILTTLLFMAMHQVSVKIPLDKQQHSINNSLIPSEEEAVHKCLPNRTVAITPSICSIDFLKKREMCECVLVIYWLK